MKVAFTLQPKKHNYQDGTCQSLSPPFDGSVRSRLGIKRHRANTPYQGSNIADAEHRLGENANGRSLIAIHND